MNNPDPQFYPIPLNRAQLDLIAQGLVELPAKHVMDLLRYLHDQVQAIDAQRDADAAKDRKAK